MLCCTWCFELILDFVLFRFKSGLAVAQTSADTFTQPEMESQGDTMHCMFNSQSSGSQTVSSSSFSSSPGAKSSNKRWTHRCSWIEISVQFYHQLQFYSIQLTHTGGSLLALFASNFISLKLACTVHRCRWSPEKTFSFYLSSFVLAPVGEKN